MHFLVAATAFAAAVSARAVPAPAPQIVPQGCNVGLCLSSLAAAGITCVGPPNPLTIARCLFGLAIPLNSEAVCGPCIPDFDRDDLPDLPDIPFPVFGSSNVIASADDSLNGSGSPDVGADAGVDAESSGFDDQADAATFAKA